MQEVKIKFGSLFVCDICGFASTDKVEVLKCQAVPVQNQLNFQIGDVLEVSDVLWTDDWYEAYALPTSKWEVVGLVIVQLNMIDERQGLSHHGLTVSLKKQETKLVRIVPIEHLRLFTAENIVKV